jgi:hypothetical protein
LHFRQAVYRKNRVFTTCYGGYDYVEKLCYFEWGLFTLNLARIDELSNDACSIMYDPDVPCIIMEWHSYGTSAQFRQISENILQLLIDQGASKVIADTTHLPIIASDDQQWVNEDWLPRAIAAGYRACGMVNSRFYFSRVAVDNVVKKVTSDQFRVEYFDSQAAAREWLKSVQVV